MTSPCSEEGNDFPLLRGGQCLPSPCSEEGNDPPPPLAQWRAMPPFLSLRGGQWLPFAQRRAMTSFPSVDSNILYIPPFPLVESNILYIPPFPSGESNILYISTFPSVEGNDSLSFEGNDSLQGHPCPRWRAMPPSPHSGGQ